MTRRVDFTTEAHGNETWFRANTSIAHNEIRENFSGEHHREDDRGFAIAIPTPFAKDVAAYLLNRDFIVEG